MSTRWMPTKRRLWCEATLPSSIEDCCQVKPLGRNLAETGPDCELAEIGHQGGAFGQELRDESFIAGSS